MAITVHFRIHRDRAGTPVHFSGACCLVVPLGVDPLPSVRSRLAADYRVATADLEVCHIEG